jgi:hypothetical protein
MAKDLFKPFSAKLTFDEKSEQFVTDGGDPRKMTKLHWVLITPLTDSPLRLNKAFSPWKRALHDSVCPSISHCLNLINFLFR